MQHRFVHVGFSLAIAAIFVALVILGTDAFIPHPDFNKEREACWRENTPVSRAATETAPTDEQAIKDHEAQKEQQECVDAVAEREKPFIQKVFIVSVVTGAVGVATSVLVLPKMLPFAASGVTFGGLFSILYGIIRSAPVTDKRLMFVIVLGVFALLLWVAWKRGKLGRSSTPEMK